MTAKAAALLALLATRRVDDSADSVMGWVALRDIAELRAWQGRRSSASLAAQVRREIRAIHTTCPDLVEASPGSQLKGPFRLASRPVVHGMEAPAMARSEPDTTSPSAASSEALFHWLEDAEPVWRSAYFHDKAGEALSNIPPVLESARADPLMRAVNELARARRLRDLGRYPQALLAVGHATSAARLASNVMLGHHLQAAAHIEGAWVHYRLGRLDAAERRLGDAQVAIAASGTFALRGRLLNLRSLVMRSRGRYEAALQDLDQAARLFVIEGDVLHILAVYHNLACLLATQAAGLSDPRRREDAFRRALAYSRRNETYCAKLGIGQNSVLNKLLQVGVLRALGDDGAALAVACAAERKALASENYPDATRACLHRLQLLVAAGQVDEARMAGEEMIARLPTAALRRQFDAALRDTLTADRRVAPDAQHGRPPAVRRRRSRAPSSR